ncbi:Thioredoxin [Histomonas meleagridis]|uniref:Thioredoxin n=1 Tax=Histomonas meleagridis TaxID=135588 RepID=UPI00355A3D13|nr:Thioredoxin [Histomonas meleagridis]KAH0800679.1 Thioredoxin [Histomonas meleagridis]
MEQFSGDSAALKKLIADGVEKGLVVVDFSADWCPDCRRLNAWLPKIIADNPDVKFIGVNRDEYRDLCSEYNVRHIPTVHFFKKVDGQPKIVETSVEPRNNQEFTALFAKHK